MAFEGLSEKLNAAFKRLRGKGRVTEADVKEAMKEVRLALLDADVSYSVVKDFVAKVTERAVGADVLESLTPAQQIIKIVNEELTALMGGGSEKISFASHPPTVIMMVGLQGAGKTTNGAKLAGLMKKQNGKRPLLAACDIYRPAAIQQLEVVGRQLDIPVFQVNTGTGCHLEADMVNHAVKHLAPANHSILFIENVGNLVCPAMFDLGEAKKVVIVSTTEGDDKPLKYPHIFAEADVCVINKTDLAPYLNTDIETLKSNALKVNHHLQVFEVSATKGDGMDAWCDWLCSECAKCK